MIYVGIDDTDTRDSPGTNQLAKAIVAELAERFECVLIIRHQLFDDPRVPYTSQNGSASIWLEPNTGEPQNLSVETLCETVFAGFRLGLKKRFVAGSDPGLCVTARVPRSVTEFGLRCQRQLMAQAEARGLAEAEGIRLEGLGGTEDGVIGALAAVGLAVTKNDGRIVQLGAWPDDLTGKTPLETLTRRSVLVREVDTERPIVSGTVDVGKHLRPNYRNGQVVLFARRINAGSEVDRPDWEAVRLR